jgi:L-ascorbate metabolism protein UlaG (beta-lactamase superfamily)
MRVTMRQIRRPEVRRLLGSVALVFGLAAVVPSQSTTPSSVLLTWMSVTNMYFEIGDLKILIDGYVTRLPAADFYGGAGVNFTRRPLKSDAGAVKRVLDAIGGPSSINRLFTGHSHFDHSLDTPTWSKLTGAPIVGSKTTCFQAIASGISASSCRVVNGGETIDLTDGVKVRVVRWNHSGDSTRNPEQHDPRELAVPPTPDPVTGGFRLGVAEDFPNGGGNRAYLFTVDGPEGRYGWFFNNSSSSADLDKPIVVDGVNYGAPIENLRAAMKASGLASLNVWIGSAGVDVAKQVVPIIKPRAFLPVHWDDFTSPFLDGVKKPFADAALETFLVSEGIMIVRPSQYMDKWALDRAGIRPVANDAVKRALGFASPR